MRGVVAAALAVAVAAVLEVEVAVVVAVLLLGLVVARGPSNTWGVAKAEADSVSSAALLPALRSEREREPTTGALRAAAGAAPPGAPGATAASDSSSDALLDGAARGSSLSAVTSSSRCPAAAAAAPAVPGGGIMPRPTRLPMYVATSEALASGQVTPNEPSSDLLASEFQYPRPRPKCSMPPSGKKESSGSSALRRASAGWNASPVRERSAAAS